MSKSTDLTAAIIEGAILALAAVASANVEQDRQRRREAQYRYDNAKRLADAARTEADRARRTCDGGFGDWGRLMRLENEALHKEEEARYLRSLWAAS